MLGQTVATSRPNSGNRQSVIESLENRTLFTVLIFEPATGSFADYGVIPQTYGDHVTAAVQGGFKYGTAGGTTPNVVASYGTTGTGATTIEHWSAGYGNLPNVAFSAPNGSKFHMALTADATHNVTLSSFDMASYNGANYVINSVQVLSGTKVLFTESNVKILGGMSPFHTHFAFSKPLTGSNLSINFDSSNQGGWNVGIDNIQFGQIALPKTTISGNVFNDLNGNGTHQTTEPSLAGWRVFVDTNNDGMYDPGDVSVLTDAKGNYTLTFTTPGKYVIGLELKRGFYQTAPHALVFTITEPGPSVTGANFGVKAISPP